MRTKIRVIKGGLIEYERALQVQKDLVQEVKSGAPGALFPVRASGDAYPRALGPQAEYNRVAP